MVRAIIKAKAIFDCFGTDDGALTVEQFAQRSKMPRSTTSNVLKTMQNSGFLLKVGNQYCLSPKIIRLADLVQSNLSICDVARPIIQAVVRKARETVTLNTRRNYERIVADVAPFQAPLMTMVRKGEHIPLLFGATSRILLAYLDESARAPVLQKMPRQVDRKHTDGWRDRAALRHYGPDGCTDSPP